MRLRSASSAIISLAVKAASPSIPAFAGAVAVAVAVPVLAVLAVLGEAGGASTGAVGGGWTTRGASRGADAGALGGGSCSHPTPGTQCRPANLSASVRSWGEAVRPEARLRETAMGTYPPGMGTYPPSRRVATESIETKIKS